MKKLFFLLPLRSPDHFLEHCGIFFWGEKEIFSFFNEDDSLNFSKNENFGCNSMKFHLKSSTLGIERDRLQFWHVFESNWTIFPDFSEFSLKHANFFARLFSLKWKKNVFSRETMIEERKKRKVARGSHVRRCEWDAVLRWARLFVFNTCFSSLSDICWKIEINDPSTFD